MHIIDHGKKYIEKNYERSFFDKLIRHFLSITLPNTKIFKLSSFFVKLSKPFQIFNAIKNKRYDGVDANTFSKKTN
jgi:glycolate oxidase iron-sulfur subunit